MSGARPWSLTHPPRHLLPTEDQGDRDLAQEGQIVVRFPEMRWVSSAQGQTEFMARFLSH